MTEDPHYQRWLAEENYWDSVDELADVHGVEPTEARVAGVQLTDGERRRIAASLDLTMTMQRVLGDAAGALETVLLRAKVLNGLGDE
jgi:hypothetical protein